MAETIKVVIQRPGQISEITEIKNSLNSINCIVGGLSTEVTIPGTGLRLIMNVNACRRNMKPTLKTLWGRIYGTVLIIIRDEDRYINLTPAQIQSAREWLLRHTYEGAKK